MKPKIPVVPLPIWKKLYEAAQQFYSLKPWELLDDLDIIGVREPATETTGYGAVMGCGGTLFGFCLYRGAEGFEVYNHLMRSNGADDFLDMFAIQNCLKIEFCSKAELEPEDQRVIKQLNLDFKDSNAWPQIRSLLPGFAPWFLTETEVKLLTLGLCTACYHYEQVNLGVTDETMRENTCLMYTPANESCTAFQANWEAFPVVQENIIMPILDIKVINSILAKPMAKDTAWATDIISLPSLIMDYERPYFLRMPALCDTTSGFAFQTMVATPDISDHQLLVNALCNTIDKLGRKPETLFVKNTKHLKALTPLGKALGISLRKKKILESILDLRNTMQGHMMKGRF